MVYNQNYKNNAALKYFQVDISSQNFFKIILLFDIFSINNLENLFHNIKLIEHINPSTKTLSSVSLKLVINSILLFPL